MSDLQIRLDGLRGRLIEALRHVPGACELYEFGSLATGDGDAYSDIDLQLVTADFSAAMAVWPEVLEKIGPMELAWPIVSSPQDSAFSVLFEGESPYHKADVGIWDVRRAVEKAPYLGERVLLWRQEPMLSDVAEVQSPAYMPEIGTAGHFLIGELLGTVRYVKARKRDQHSTCWRFASAKLDALLRLIYERSLGWKTIQGRLTTRDHVALDGLVPEPERLAALRLLDPSTPRSMDLSLCRITHRIAELAGLKARANGEKIPEALLRRHLAFVREGLGIVE